MWYLANILELLPEQLMYIIMITSTFFVGSILLLLFKDKLPKDNGREFAYNGSKSAGKPRGAGIIIISVFTISSLIFIHIKLENVIYYLLIFSSMLSGFLDDKSDKPWGEYKKGMIDLVISIITAYTFINFNPSETHIKFLNYEYIIPKYIFIVIATLLIWVSINATNCSDGIDGYCGTLSIITVIFIGVILKLAQTDPDILNMIVLFIFSILPYLWLNSEPSQMMMGDAGSRAIGLFISITILKTGNIVLFIPLCFVILCDGLLGIVKIFFLRFLKIHLFKNIRTPLHDHLRKNMNWSNAQTIMRLTIVQVILSTLTVLAIK